MTDAERERQIKHVNEALALLERQPTPEELAAAQSLLQRDPVAPQAELKLG